MKASENKPKNRIIFRLSKEVNPTFKEVWYSSKPYIVLKGGRNSFKSSVISLWLVIELIKYINMGEKANVIVIRKVASTIRDSVFLKIQWALDKLGILNQFKTTVGPFKIVHKKTGSAFHFYGQDDFAKLKSNDIGNIIAVWYEESAEFASSEDFDQTNATFMRQKHKLSRNVYFFWSYNPPRNPYSWINQWTEDLKGVDNYLVHHSSYQDDQLGFVTDQMREEINRIKENDYDYYRYLFLGEAVGLGTNIYNMNLVNVVKEIPSDEVIQWVGYSADVGHQSSATSVGLYAVTHKGNVYRLDGYYYSPHNRERKKSPGEMAKDIREYIKSFGYKGYTLTIDSAEGAFRNQYFADYGERWLPSQKKAKYIMIDYTHNLLAQGRFFVIKNDANQIFIEEMRQYAWDESTLQSELPQPIKENDHSVDEFQYFIMNHARRLGLKF